MKCFVSNLVISLAVLSGSPAMAEPLDTRRLNQPPVDAEKKCAAAVTGFAATKSPTSSIRNQAPALPKDTSKAWRKYLSDMNKNKGMGPWVHRLKELSKGHDILPLLEESGFQHWPTSFHTGIAKILFNHRTRLKRLSTQIDQLTLKPKGKYKKWAQFKEQQQVVLNQINLALKTLRLNPTPWNYYINRQVNEMESIADEYGRQDILFQIQMGRQEQPTSSP